MHEPNPTPPAFPSKIQACGKSLLVKCGIVSMLACWMFSSLADAQTNKVASMRELRIKCLETFNTTQERLEELRAFVDQQTDRQRSAAIRLFALQQNVTSAKRTIVDLQQQQTNLITRVEQARGGVERAVTSYKAAGRNLPTGESWADDGSRALTELRREADAAPRDQWKHKRVKEAESEIASTVHDWRAARREFEHAGFDLDLRAAPVIFNRISNQLAVATAELNSQMALLADREKSLSALETDGEKWKKTIRELNLGNAEARKRLAKAAIDFHLVDLKFTAWRLNQAGLPEEGISSLPDTLERQIGQEFRPVGVTPLHGTAGEGGMLCGSDVATSPTAPASSEAAENAKSSEENMETDAAFRELLDRINTDLSRLQFLLEAWNGESSSVQSAIGTVEESDAKAKSLVDETTSLAADLESLRRSTESTKLDLSTGLATIDLVQKRHTADIQEINHLLDDATTRTAQLQKSLDQP
jgi:chromosome segregation ATPase